MSSGGVFNSVIKSNKSIMLDKTKRFRKTPGGFNNSKTSQLTFKKATPQQLVEIELRLQKRAKHATKQSIIFTVIVIIIVSIGFFFVPV